MYLDHFGMRELPFRLTPDTSFFFNHASHQEALNVLQVALRSGEGFIKITGEVGTGKTMLCRMLLNSLDDTYITAYIPNPYLSPAALYLAVADELEISYPQKTSYNRLLGLINDHSIRLSEQGKSVVICMDEVQSMPEKTLEALRLLSNLETEKSKLLQVIMFGQPELDTLLARPTIRQLRQRIGFSYKLQPLTRQTLFGYVQYRLRVADFPGEGLFHERAITELHKSSRGIPRLVNMLSHKALMAAYGKGQQQVTRQHIRMAANDTEDAAPTRAARSPLVFKLATMGTVVLFAGAGAAYFMGLMP